MHTLLKKSVHVYNFRLEVLSKIRQDSKHIKVSANDTKIQNVARPKI